MKFFKETFFDRLNSKHVSKPRLITDCHSGGTILKSFCRTMQPSNIILFFINIYNGLFSLLIKIQ